MMKLKKNLSILILSLSLTASFSPSVFAENPQSSPQTPNIDTQSTEYRYFEVYRYFNVGEGVPQAIAHFEDGYGGSLTLRSYENDGTVVFARYAGFLERTEI